MFYLCNYLAFLLSWEAGTKSLFQRTNIMLDKPAPNITWEATLMKAN